MICCLFLLWVYIKIGIKNFVVDLLIVELMFWNVDNEVWLLGFELMVVVIVL